MSSSYPFCLVILPVHFDIQEKDFNALRCSILAVCTDYGVECPGRRMKMEPVGQWDHGMSLMFKPSNGKQANHGPFHGSMSCMYTA